MRRIRLRPVLFSILMPAALAQPAAGLTASVEADGYSFSMGAAATSAGYTVFFTTHTDSNGPPLADCGMTTCTVSGELSPVSLGSTQYWSDYFAQIPAGTFEYGSVLVSIGASDADGDGLLDVLQREHDGDFSVAGTTVPDFNAYNLYFNSSISASVQRAAGSVVGTYSGTLSNPSVSPSFAGNFALLGLSGTVEYNLGGPFLTWNLSQRGIDGVLRTFTGASHFDRVDSSAISIPSFALADSTSDLFLFVDAATLTRSGNVFQGFVSVEDGGVTTSWPDFVAYRVKIRDDNDTNEDGLPDLVPEPASPPASWAAAGTVAMLVWIRSRRVALRI
jgi:hypothetical protein